MVRPHSRFLVRLEMTGRMRLAETEKSENFEFVFGLFFFCGNHRLWMRRSWSPESTSRRELFESFDRAQDRLREFSRHLIRGVGGGTRKRMGSFFTILWRATDGRKWFWFLLPKQKGLVAWGRNPTLIFFNHAQENFLATDVRKKCPST